ncbi:MAG: acylneuraminate cytidylyltransferase [Lentimicrobium sp.]|nr:acylneuraminate cytidylyltransferase [Lentimicrobium sp.]
MSSKIKVVFTDVDGVWTDGRICYSDDGKSARKFHVWDAIGVSILKNIGVTLVVLTGDESAAVKARFADLNIKFLYTGLRNKLYIAEEVLSKLGFTFTETAYIGDDISDLPLLRKAFISAVPNGVPDYIAEQVTWKLSRRGGEGVFREFAEKIAQNNGEWDSFLGDYLTKIST